MKRTFLVPLLFILSFLAGSTFIIPQAVRADDQPTDQSTTTPADDSTTTPPVTTPPAQDPDPTPVPPAPTTIHANVNVRYQGSLVWSGTVALVQGSTANIIDDSGASRTIPSDSALEALATADTESSDFAVTDLKYYADYGSFFINCLDIAATATHACNNWQYVVDSAYPPIGADKYVVSNGDTIYFYFGTPHRVSLPRAAAEASTSIAVKAETYDYTNDTWRPLAGAVVGATQPNPSDPYSPLVVASATSDSDGIARLVIVTPGSYGVGLAQDYYSAPETLVVTAAQQPDIQADVTSRSGSRGGSASAEAAGTTSQIASSTSPLPLGPAAFQTAAVGTAGDALIALDIPLRGFITRYALLVGKSFDNLLASLGI